MTATLAPDPVLARRDHEHRLAHIPSTGDPDRALCGRELGGMNLPSDHAFDRCVVCPDVWRSQSHP